MAIELNDQQKKESIIAALKGLKDHIGRKVVVKALEENVKEAEKRLHGDIKLEEGETMKFWQKIRKDRIEMINLPDSIIEDFKKNEGFDPNLDPYE